MMRPRHFALLCIAFASTAALAEGSPEQGRAKSEVCAGCHGADGNSNAPIFPKLAGQHAGYLSKQLHDFKSQKRPDPTMSALAEPLSDADIADLAAYYAQQKTTIEPGEPNANGAAFYRGGNPATGAPACIGCHGPEGKGNPQAGYPAINGQFAAYAEKTLRDFKAGQRGNDANGVMRAIAAKLSEAEITAISDHVSSLK